MADILNEIIAHKRQELTQLTRKRVSMAGALRRSPSGIIAEFKRKSPSRGWIHADVEPEQVIPQYVQGGAAALSILTDEAYFGGSPEFITRVRGLVGTCPILRKEFIVSPIQVYEARLLGADAILLIAACLEPEEYAGLLQLAHSLGLEVLLEVHDPSELAYLDAGMPDMLGVNNRSLGTFHTDVRHSFEMAALMQKAVARPGEAAPVLVSESGISQPAVVRQLRQAGFRGFLIGECFMREADPGRALAEFIRTLTPAKPTPANSR